MKLKKGGAKNVDDHADETHAPLQAILLADSFAQKFRPITLERPKVLLPLVNRPMINYTLEWLESAGVKDVFVFCCAHSKQVIDFLDNSNWFSHPNFSITAIESHDSTSVGDALRLINDRNLVHGDFILISGDTVTNISLAQVLQEHRERKKKDNNAIMTMILKKSKPSTHTHLSRLGTDEIFLAINPHTQQLVYYEDERDHSKGILSLDKMFLNANPSISLHSDKQDCYIDICSPEVLDLFKVNFDYQHLRRHFVKDLLSNTIMDYKIFTFEIRSSYAARVDNFRSYDTVSKDIIQRWTYPFVPDLMTAGDDGMKHERQCIYKAPGIGLSRSARIGPSTVIGTGTRIGDRTVIADSVVGERCSIGSDVLIEGCFVWNDVVVEDGCKLRHAVLCDGVLVRSGGVLERGAVVSFKVVIGGGFVVPAYSKVSLLEQPVKQDSDDELEYADTDDRPAASEVGSGGAGLIWSACEGSEEEEWRQSVAPIPADKFTRFRPEESEIEPEDAAGDSNARPPNSCSDDGGSDDSHCFEKLVEDAFLSAAVHENGREKDVISEVNSQRFLHNMTSLDCASSIFSGLMRYVLEIPRSSPVELQKNLAASVVKWKTLLKYYIPGVEEEIEVIFRLEEMCLHVRELSDLFPQIMHVLYDKEMLREEGILSWVSEKEEGDPDSTFLQQSRPFISWLNEASEEDD